MTDQLGRTVDYTYDRQYRLTHLTLPDPDLSDSNPDRPDIEYVYNDAGELIREFDPLNNETQYVYDGLGRLEQLLLPEVDNGSGTLARPTFTNRYDVYDRVITTTDPLGIETEYMLRTELWLQIWSNCDCMDFGYLGWGVTELL